MNCTTNTKKQKIKEMIALRVVVNGVAVVVNPFGWKPGFGLEDDE